VAMGSSKVSQVPFRPAIMAGLGRTDSGMGRTGRVVGGRGRRRTGLAGIGLEVVTVTLIRWSVFRVSGGTIKLYYGIEKCQWNISEHFDPAIPQDT